VHLVGCTIGISKLSSLHQERSEFPLEEHRQITNNVKLRCVRATIIRMGKQYLFIFNYALQLFKAYCAIWVRRSNFRHQASPRVSPRERTQRRKVELWARNVR